MSYKIAKNPNPNPKMAKTQYFSQKQRIWPLKYPKTLTLTLKWQKIQYFFQKKTGFDLYKMAKNPNPNTKNAKKHCNLAKNTEFDL